MKTTSSCKIHAETVIDCIACCTVDLQFGAKDLRKSIDDYMRDHIVPELERQTAIALAKEADDELLNGVKP